MELIYSNFIEITGFDDQILKIDAIINKRVLSVLY